jgi:type III secretory pathway component EscU
MAGEEMFVAASITAIGMLGTFIFLYSQSKHWLWARVWMMAIFSTIYISLNVMRKGFQNVLVMNDMADLYSALMTAIMWVMILLIGYLFLGIAYYGLRRLKDAAEGRMRDDELQEETWKGM